MLRGTGRYGTILCSSTQRCCSCSSGLTRKQAETFPAALRPGMALVLTEAPTAVQAVAILWVARAFKKNTEVPVEQLE